MYKDYLIYYGKFKYSNKFEIHFLDTKNPDANVINGGAVIIVQYLVLL